MDDEYEWGPWVEHDGLGCPCVGEYVCSTFANGEETEHVAHGLMGGVWGIVVDSWDWSQCYLHNKPDWRLLRYRIRKPRSKAMSILRDLVKNTKRPIMAPEGPVRAPQTAGKETA